jgi:hypothetical protein
VRVVLTSDKAVAALAESLAEDAAARVDALATWLQDTPVVILDNPRNLGNVGAVLDHHAARPRRPSRAGPRASAANNAAAAKSVTSPAVRRPWSF